MKILQYLLYILLSVAALIQFHVPGFNLYNGIAIYRAGTKLVVRSKISRRPYISRSK